MASTFGARHLLNGKSYPHLEVVLSCLAGLGRSVRPLLQAGVCATEVWDALGHIVGVVTPLFESDGMRRKRFESDLENAAEAVLKFGWDEVFPFTIAATSLLTPGVDTVAKGSPKESDRLWLAYEQVVAAMADADNSEELQERLREIRAQLLLQLTLADANDPKLMSAWAAILQEQLDVDDFSGVGRYQWRLDAHPETRRATFARIRTVLAHANVEDVGSVTRCDWALTRLHVLLKDKATTKEDHCELLAFLDGRLAVLPPKSGCSQVELILRHGIEEAIALLLSRGTRSENVLEQSVARICADVDDHDLALARILGAACRNEMLRRLKGRSATIDELSVLAHAGLSEARLAELV